MLLYKTTEYAQSQYYIGYSIWACMWGTLVVLKQEANLQTTDHRSSPSAIARFCNLAGVSYCNSNIKVAIRGRHSLCIQRPGDLIYSQDVNPTYLRIVTRLLNKLMYKKISCEDVILKASFGSTGTCCPRTQRGAQTLIPLCVSIPASNLPHGNVITKCTFSIEK